MKDAEQSQFNSGNLAPVANPDEQELAVSISDGSLSGQDEKSNGGCPRFGTMGEGSNGDAQGSGDTKNFTKVNSGINLNLNSPGRNDAGSNYGALSNMTGDDFGDINPGSPKIVTEEKLQCYEKFKSLPIIIEGPEFCKDFSYFL
jgi:hypothetical protein